MHGHSADTDADMARLTETLVKNAEAPAKGAKITYDADLKGFGLRVTATGARAFVLNYRAGGRERRLTIGSYPEWSATAARKRAETLKREIDTGADPMAERHADRAAPTIADLCDLYVERHLPKKRPASQEDDKAAITKVIRPRLGKVKVADLRHSDVEALHRDLSKTAPYRANRIAALLSKMFALAIKWGFRTDNPVTGLERNAEVARTRYLDKSELVALGAALDAHPSQTAANAIRLLLLTGARRGEVLAATWSQFDLSVGVWTKPRENTKAKREHRIPLNAPALRLLLAMRDGAGGSPYLFPSHGTAGHIVEIKGAWARVTRAAKLENARIHDLRHTYASFLASAGFSLPTVGALLGHTQAQTTQRYAHLLDDPLRVATDKVGSMLLIGRD